MRALPKRLDGNLTPLLAIHGGVVFHFPTETLKLPAINGESRTLERTGFLPQHIFQGDLS